MTSLREIIFGETKLQKALRENREQEPILEGWGKGRYYQILEELSEENELYRSDRRVTRIQDSILLGVVLGGMGVTYTAMIGKTSFATQLIPVLWGIIGLHKCYETQEEKRGRL